MGANLSGGRTRFRESDVCRHLFERVMELHGRGEGLRPKQGDGGLQASAHSFEIVFQ